jgi:hypothetical protein
MGEPIFAMIVPLGQSGPIDPGFGNRPIHHPGHPDHGLPSQPGSPSQPIYHPGHPSHGLPAYPSQGLPGQQPGQPGQGLPPFPSQGLPPGGTDIPSNELPMPEPPSEYADKLIVAIHKPGEEDWQIMAYDPNVHPDQGLPPVPGTPTHPVAPTPAPTSQRRK